MPAAAEVEEVGKVPSHTEDYCFAVERIAVLGETGVGEGHYIGSSSGQLVGVMVVMEVHCLVLTVEV